MSSRFSRRRSLESLFVMRAIVFGCFMLLFVVGVVSGGDMKERAVMATSGIDTATRGETFVATRMDINYMSKRKVFNGPDPIHNRRAGNSRQPPGKA